MGGACATPRTTGRLAPHCDPISIMEYEEEGEQWQSGYECTFVEEPPDDLICLICTFVARDPQQLTCCGRVFCCGCLARHRSTSPKCPNCSRMISNFPDSRSERHIKALRVLCNSNKLGCSWEGELRHLSAHEKQCQLARVECPYKCFEVVKRQDLYSHTRFKCPRRPYKCPHCPQVGTYRAITSMHLQECPEMVVSCPNGCRTPGITRGQLDNHRETCPLEEVTCWYSEVGCSTELCRQDQSRHESTNQLQHLRMMMESVCILKKSLNKLKTQQQLKAPIAVFKMPKFQELKSNGRDWTSPPFFTHPNGYKISLNVVPNGYETGEGTHLSAFIYIMKGENDANLPWPCKAHVTIQLLNQLHDEGHYSHTVSLEDENVMQVPKGETTGRGYGPHRFVAHEKLQYNVSTDTHYLKNDCLYFQIYASCDSIYRPWLREFH